MVNKNSKKIPQFAVCFSNNGDLHEKYVDMPDPSKPLPPYYSKDYYKQFVWEPNQIFSDTLEYLKCYPTNGSAHFIFISRTNGRRYSMFLSDFDDMMKEKRLNNNILKGEFYFCKKGCSQGLKMIF